MEQVDGASSAYDGARRLEQNERCGGSSLELSAPHSSGPPGAAGDIDANGMSPVPGQEPRSVMHDNTQGA